MDVTLVGGAGVALIVVIYRLLTERGEIRDLRDDMATLKREFALLKKDYDFQRHRAHELITILATSVGYTDLSASMTEKALSVLDKCTCDAVQSMKSELGPISDVLAGLRDKTAEAAKPARENQ